MDEESINIYLKALETGSEQRRDINLVIVGKQGVGKTSLVRRLFGENIADVKSTNGIEIHRRRCRISLNNWECNKIPDTTAMKESSINNRLLQSMVKELHHGRENENKHMFKTSSLDMLELDENEENECITATGQVTKQLHDLQFSTDEQLTISESITSSHSSELALQMLSSIIRPDLDLQDEDSHASLTVWDFAGDKEFYNTHQTFLNPEAIYLVVANLADINSTESHGTFKFWMDTIHCYSSKSEVGGILDPAVIAVGTHKDKFEDEEQCRELLASYTGEIFTDSKLHLRSTHLISNTDDQEYVFRELRNDIFATANNSANWNREYPVKFIQIEKAINWELMNGKRIIPFERVKELGSNTSMPISDDKELLVFLKYQHQVGNLLFFEDIPLYIILDPQWLANAFKCIVTAEQFQLELPHLEWSGLKKTGKMDSKLLNAIFRKQSRDIRNHKEHILEVIEKFDIIIRPSLLMDNGSVQQELCFFVPCMIQTSNVEDIDKVFKVPEASKSTCLCFVFKFLPPHLFSILIVSCLRKYSLAAIGGQLGLFKDSCVYNISQNGCVKFLLAKCHHIIELQVWQWGEANLMINQDVLQFVEMEINRIVNTRYKLKTVSFEKKWKCETTRYSFDKGFHELDEVHDGEYYFCEEHSTVHRYDDHWSGNKTKVPGELSNEQRNFTRLSMVVLDILRRVLYDRLDLDKNAGQVLVSCGQYDITSLYQEHCKLNRHIPSKGRWRCGKTVDDIPPNETCIGDDIERIRLIRNEMQHSSVFALDDTRYQLLITNIQDMLTRFDQRNKPTGDPYVNRLQEIRKMELKRRHRKEIMERIKPDLTLWLNRVIEDTLLPVGKVDELETRFHSKTFCKMETLEQVKPKNQFYDHGKVDSLYKISFSFGLELIIGRRLEEEYMNLMRPNKSDKNAKHKDKQHIRITEAFQNLMSLRKVGTTHTDLKSEFENSILSDESLVCRYILTHFQNLFDSIDMLKKGLRLAMENRKPNCAKVIAWDICRRYARTMSITQYYDIWPGLECGCNSQNTSFDMLFCSCNVVIVAEVNKMVIITPERETFYGIRIMYKEVNGHSEEAKSLMEEVDSTIDARKPYETSQDVSDEKATEYFDKHSKLTMISKSHLKSKGFGKEIQKFERVSCIQLFCRAKGIVPIGESHFPDKIGSVQTDIFEGYPRLQAKQIRIGTEYFVPTEEENNSGNGQNAAARPDNEYENMDIDNDASRQFKGKAGTIGGFLKFHGEDAFLTCAHAILSPDFLISHTFGSELHENPVKIYCKDENSLRGVIPCGHLASFTFPPNEINGSSIDAAIIRIDRSRANIYMDDTERRELKSNYLQRCCLDWQEVGVHTDFEVRTFGAVSLDQHIKDRVKIIEGKTVEFETLYQAVANVYRDINRANVQDNIHVAVQAIDIVSKRHSDLPKSVIFRNQIAMNKIKFQQGDSGMCIYVRHNDGLFWCIGMAIATHPAGGCIMTPLKAILKHFNY
ncbi:unnamed protein product [Mytilus coruscus]|uniref:non-specific serine/threonine protein kinase n=1 Tax=Mytilus coruscus TaxID=42192 RepID=A0A6J8A6Q6_MYTCO|nr:unnamed protein product [Mytilus coruscus]